MPSTALLSAPRSRSSSFAARAGALGIGPVLDHTRLEQRPLSLPVPPPSIVDFYHDLGDPFMDSKTGKPVRDLAPYQLRTLQNHAAHRKLLVLKSQKIGLSSLGIVMTLHHALTDCQGFQLIILAQSIEKAIEHAEDLQNLVKTTRYRDYLIEKPSQLRNRAATRHEITRVKQVMLQTRDPHMRPTKIYVLPPTPPAIASLKRVRYIWASDITIIRDLPERQQQYFQALTSRLILTEGHIFIECPTVGHLGPIYDIDERFQASLKAGRPVGPHDFFVDRIKVQEAVDAGLMTEAAVQAEREEHGPMFDAYFNADWFAGDSVWYRKDQLSRTTNWATSLVEDVQSPADRLVLEEIASRQSGPMYGIQTPLPPLRDIQVPDPIHKFRDAAWFAGLDPAVKVDHYGVTIHGLFPKPADPAVPWTPFLRDVYNIRHESMTDVTDWLLNVLFRAYPPRSITIDATRDTPAAEEIEARFGSSRVEALKVSNQTNYELKQNAYAYLSEKTEGGYAFPDTSLMLDRRKAVTIADLKLQSMHERVEYSPTGAPTFTHPRGRHNDMNRSWEMSLRGVRKFQTGRLAYMLSDAAARTRTPGSDPVSFAGGEAERAARTVSAVTTGVDRSFSTIDSIYGDTSPRSSSDARNLYH